MSLIMIPKIEFKYEYKHFKNCTEIYPIHLNTTFIIIIMI